MSVDYSAATHRPRNAYARRFPVRPAPAIAIGAAGKATGGVVKRSVKVGSRRTSISVEDVFWAGLREIARLHRVPIHRLLAEIADCTHETSLSSAIRVTVFNHFHQRAAMAKGEKNYA